MAELPWTMIVVLAATGLLMGLVSCLVGMRPKVENSAWWALYAVWVAVVLLFDRGAPFLTILIASALAGALHGTTRALLLAQYRAHNPWHAKWTRGPRAKLALQFVVMGVVIGTAFGAVVGGIAWGLSRL
ncbi:MAG: hypothetical protein PVI01_06590 [Gemmatimonadales bacterium]|jgi:hypothetical protein